MHSVTPTADGARLLIVVKPSAEVGMEALDGLYRALEGARTWLRRQVAAEIHRKRAPDLVFQILPPWEDEP